MLRSREHSPWYDVYVATLSVLVALIALAAGIYVPLKIDNDAQGRERTRSCLEAVIDLRGTMGKLKTGYATASDSLQDRLADWDSAINAFERTRVTCRNSQLPKPRKAQSAEALSEQVHTGRERALTESRDLSSATDTLDWTIDCIKNLTAYSSD
ncbi:hypothetical protein DFR72_10881 [Lentzea flaviverrucosa]|uniref:Uncharacterized protein n=1 Tax=Lentzea flaviverrucosa TaxID=200379 RepID=A0A1H9SJI8_9PSEU|nr:hypothetical protein DFR72_10881 [Lentzea flaviverrucosa]SER84845.1 hypothetical protein SAMN05216195_10782 [Lentzea flaviverrucosa]